MTVKRKRTIGSVASAILLAALLLVTLAACFGGEVVLTFNVNGGTPCEQLTVEKGTETLALPVTTKDGYDFAGWYADRALTVPVESLLTGEEVPTASMTLHAKWVVRNVTITFTAGDELVGELVVAYGTEVRASSFPSLEKFDGYEWRTADFTATYDREIRAMGVGGAEEQYYATYYVPSENGFVEYARFAADADGRVDVPSTPSAGENAYFGGWYYNSGYTSECETLPTELPGGDVNLYARFIELRDDTKYLFYESTEDGVVITGLTGVGSYQTFLTIPARIAGKPVIQVGGGASKTLSSAFLESVVIAAGVREIDDRAFDSCVSLTEVVFLGDEVTRIGEGAFASCTSLATFDLPDSVTVVEDGAFAGDEALRAWNVGEESKLSHIGEGAFDGCAALTGVTLGKVIREVEYTAFVGSGLQRVDAYEGGRLKSVDGVLYTANGETLVYYPLHGAAEYTMPDGVKTIAPKAFYDNDDLREVTVCSSLTTIGERAFYHCENLTNATLSGSALTAVGASAFSDCVSLSSVAFPSTLKTVGTEAYRSCGALTTLTFGTDSALRSIGDGAFRECVGLTEVAMPIGTESVGDYAFYGCADLRTLELSPRGVLARVGDYAFYDCVKIGNVLLTDKLTYVGEYAFASKDKAMSLELDSRTQTTGVEHLGEGAFMNTKIVSITVSSRIASNVDFGKNAFYGCTYLRQAFFSAAGYDTLPEGTFYGCTSLNRVTFPANVETVGKRAFYNCGALEYADFGSHVTSIEESAFEGCTNMTNGNGIGQRVLPATLTNLGARAFYGCRSLETVSIPSGLTELKASVFEKCISLTSIQYDAGTTLTTIGENAFAGCASLTTANLPVTLARKDAADTQGLVKNPFFGCTALTAFNVPGIADGQFTANGITVADGVLYVKEREDGDYPELSVYAFPTAGSTGTYIVPARTEIGKQGEGFNRQIIVTGIERYAFYGARITQLNFAAIPESNGVEDLVFLKIGDYAFADSNLTLIGNLSYRVYEVGAYAFYQCKLTNINVDATYIYGELVDRDGVPTMVYRDAANRLKNVLNAEQRDDNLLTIGAYAFSETTLESFTAPARLKEIGEGAFSKNYSLSSVSLLGGVTDAGCITDLVIGDGAFSENNLLTSVTIPASTSRIGDRAFYRCYNVSTLRFGARTATGYRGYIDVGAYAFGEIHYLYSVTLPVNLRSLGEGVFAQNTRLKYVTFADELATDAGLGDDAPSVPDYAFVGATNMEEIVIPAYITGIGAYAFRNTSLRTITFLGTLTDADFVIGEGAFSELKTLTSVTLPDNLTYIGEIAFAKTPLADVTIGENGKALEVGGFAFWQTNLTTFTVNKRITDMGEGAFSEIPTLTTFTVADDNLAYGAVAEGLLQGDSALRTASLGNVSSVGAYAFTGTDIRELTSDRLTYVGSWAFMDTALERVTITGAELYIDDYAFAAAKNVQEVNADVTGSLYVGAFAFSDCDRLTTITLRGSIDVEEGFAAYSAAVENVDIDDGNGFIGVDGVLYADDGATFLYYPPKRDGATFELGPSVTAIADYAFADAEGLTGVIVKGENVTKGASSFGTAGSLTVYVAKERVEYYANEWKMNNLSADVTVMGGLVLTLNNLGQYELTGYLGTEDDVTVNGTMTEDGIVYVVSGIGENAFKNNVGLRTITLGSGIKTVAVGAFENCVRLRRAVIGENVTSVKSYAFSGCTELEEVVFAADGSLLSIGNYSFANCPALTSFVVPDSVESMGIFAFSGDTALVDVRIGTNVTEIGNNAFGNCTSLVSVDIPASVVKMGSYVFGGCENLIAVNVLGRRVVEIESNTFDGTIDGIYFFVPDPAVEKSYKSDSVWREHISKILSAENRLSEAGYENYVVKDQGDGYALIAYLGTESDVRIAGKIGSIDVISIGEYAIGQFARTVTIDEGVTTISARAFVHAANLVSVELPSTLTTIGQDAFSMLLSLSDVTVRTRKERKLVVLKSDFDAGRSVEDSVQSIYENVTDLQTIGDRAFYSCVALHRMVVPESVTTIGSYAFAYTALEELIFRHSDVNGTEWYSVNMGSDDTPDYQTAKYVVNTSPRGAANYVTSYKNAALTLGDNAFRGNVSLRTFTLNTKLASVGTQAFAGCTLLESVYWNYEPRTVANAMPSGSGVTQGVFEGCNKLSVFLPTVDICTLLKGEWKSDVDKYKFVAKTYESDGFVFAAINRDSVTVINYIGTATEVTFPSTVRIGLTNYNVTRIGREATIKTNAETEVKGYVIGSNVTKVTLSEKVVTIGADAFRNSASLETVVLNSGVTTIESYAFAGCTNLRYVNVPVTVTTIESYAFYDCDSLNDGLVFDEPFTPPTTPTLIIGGYAFADCDGLESFYVTNLVWTIGGIRSTGNTTYGHTFDRCSSLRSVTFSENALITRIETYAFANTPLVEITLPASLESISDNVFYGCADLARVYLKKEISVTEAAGNVFNGVDSPHLKVYVPESTYEAYTIAQGWRNKTVIIDRVTADGAFAYEIVSAGSVKLTDYRGSDEVLVVPAGVRIDDGGGNIGTYVVDSVGRYFANASVRKVEFNPVRINDETISVAVTKIDDYAFSSCTSLEEIHMPDTVTSLGQRAFEGCTSLTDVTLSFGLQEISEFTFYNCRSLREITLPAAITRVGNSAFTRCLNLARVRVEFGAEWEAANVTGSLGNSAFADTGTGLGGLTVIVPERSYGIMYSGWTDIRTNLYAQSALVGDFVVKLNDRGTEYILVQYLGTEEEVDLTALDIKGYKIGSIAENAVGNTFTRFLVDEHVTYAAADAWRVEIKE